MWRCEETLLNHAVQKKREKKSAMRHSMGCGCTWGKVNACILHLCKEKKTTQRKHVNIKVLAWNKFCTQRAFRLFLSCTAVWPSGPLGRVPRVPRRAVPFKQWVVGGGDLRKHDAKCNNTHDGEGGGAYTRVDPVRTQHDWACFFMNRLGVPKKPFAHRRCAVVWCLGWAWETTWSTSRLPWRPSGAHSLWTPPPLPRPSARPLPPPLWQLLAPSLTALRAPLLHRHRHLHPVVA